MNSAQRTERQKQLLAFVVGAWPRVAHKIALSSTSPETWASRCDDAARQAWLDESNVAKADGLYKNSTYCGDIATTLMRTAELAASLGMLKPVRSEK